MSEELEISSADENTEKQVLEDETLVKDQSTGPTREILSEDDMTATVPKQEVNWMIIRFEFF